MSRFITANNTTTNFSIYSIFAHNEIYANHSILAIIFSFKHTLSFERQMMPTFSQRVKQNEIFLFSSRFNVHAATFGSTHILNGTVLKLFQLTR